MCSIRYVDFTTAPSPNTSKSEVTKTGKVKTPLRNLENELENVK